MQNIDKRYYVNMGPHGTFRASGQATTTPSDIDAICAFMKHQGRSRLALHFHGGLVNEKRGLDIAWRMVPVYEKAGSHPVTIVWETGLLETLTRNLATIHHTQLFQKLLLQVLQAVTQRLGGIGGRGPGQPVPKSDIEAELAKADPFATFEAAARTGAERLTLPELEALEPEVAAELEEQLDADPDIPNLLQRAGDETTLLDRQFLAEMDDQRSKGIFTMVTVAAKVAKVVYKVVRRFTEQRDHDLYPTIVEEILREFYMADAGAWVWQGMKTTAQDMWLPNDGLAGDDLHAGTYLLDRLAALSEEMPDLQVDLIGHSAGAIAICHLLNTVAARYPQLRERVRYVVFLAPACTMELFRQEICDHSERYQDFRMFTMRDDYEARDRLVPGLYIHSLLYFISGVLENTVDMPLAGMERYHRATAPYNDEILITVGRFLRPESANRVVLANSRNIAPLAEDGFHSTAERHGDFDDDPETRASMIVMMQQ